MRFSVPSIWTWRSRKLLLAFSSGYRSLDGKQPAEATRQTILKFLKLSQLLRVRGSLGRINRDFRCAGPRVNYVSQRRLFKVRCPFHGMHEVRDQVCPALILGLQTSRRR